MAWGRLDDQSNSNAKLLALSDGAWRMWGCAIIYCQANLTDGFIPEHAIQTFGVRARNKRAVADELCAVLVPGKGPLWHKVEGGYQVHDYFDWNESREEILAAREKSKERIEKWRASRNGVQNALQNALPTPHGTHSVQVSTTTTTVQRKERAVAPREKPTAPTRELMTLFDACHQQKLGSKAQFSREKDAAILAQLWRDRRDDTVDVETIIREFFEIDDEWVRKRGYSVSTLLTQVSAILSRLAEKHGQKAAPSRGSHVPDAEATKRLLA